MRSLAGLCEFVAAQTTSPDGMTSNNGKLLNILAKEIQKLTEPGVWEASI
jgi:hypothetical protein